MIQPNRNPIGTRHKMVALIREQLVAIEELISEHEEQLEILYKDREGAIKAIEDSEKYMEKLERKDDN